jgi:hypothetical protein
MYNYLFYAAQIGAKKRHFTLEGEKEREREREGGRGREGEMDGEGNGDIERKSSHLIQLLK